MLKDILKKNIGQIKKRSKHDEIVPFHFNGELKIIAEKNGKIIHEDIGHNIVTVWAKHATIHLLTTETYSTHGNKDDKRSPAQIAYSGRSITGADHTTSINIDGTVISNEDYLGDNTNYYSSGHLYQSLHNTTYTPNGGLGDDLTQTFIYPFFPTKMLFGTGIEYASWAEVVTDGKDGTGIDGYGHANNGGWDETTFNTEMSNVKNYYSAEYDDITDHEIIPKRTVNDIYSGVLLTTPTDEDFGIEGAIKDAAYNNSGTDGSHLTTDGSGNYVATGSWRGIGQPSFIYAKRGTRTFSSSSEVMIDQGDVNDYLETKLTYTVVLPEQTIGEFYPYNGYTLKVAGLFADARMLLNNTEPTGSGDESADEFDNYHKMPCGIMWAKRNISPIYKSHDIKITAQWTVYLP